MKIKTYKVQGLMKSGTEYRFIVQSVNEMVAQRAIIDRIHAIKNSIDTITVTEATLDEVLKANRILVVEG